MMEDEEKYTHRKTQVGNETMNDDLDWSKHWILACATSNVALSSSFYYAE